MLSFKELANEGIICKQFDDFNNDAVIFRFEKGEARYQHILSKQDILQQNVPFAVIESILCHQAKEELNKLLEGVANDH